MQSPFVVEIAVGPKNRTDRAALRRALDRVLDGDRSLAACEDEKTGQTIVRATDECGLDAVIVRLRHDLDQRLDVGAPRVVYREYLAKPVELTCTHKRQSGGSGEFAEVKVKVFPGELGSGFVFLDKVENGNIPKAYISSIEKGMQETAQKGSLIGFPIVDFEVHLIDGKYHDVDSSARAFEICARGVMREAAQKAGIKILEPIMKVVVLAPDCWREAVVAHLVGRRAAIESQSESNLCVVVALAPIAQLLGYRNALAAATQGEARSAMLLDHYDPVPHDIVPDDTFPAAAALRE